MKMMTHLAATEASSSTQYVSNTQTTLAHLQHPHTADRGDDFLCLARLAGVDCAGAKNAAQTGGGVGRALYADRG